MIVVHHKGEQLRGDAKKLIGFCEGNGYNYERNNQHAEAHSIWQLGEFIKRELDRRESGATDRTGRAGKKHTGNSRNYGRRSKPEYDFREITPDTGEGQG